MKILEKGVLFLLLVSLCLTQVNPIQASELFKPKYEKEAKKLYDFGFVKGSSDTSIQLNLDYPVTREEGIIIALRLSNKVEEVEKLTENEVRTEMDKYTDGNSVSKWAEKYIAYAIKKGIIFDDKIDPKKNIEGNSFAFALLKLLGYEEDINESNALEILKEKNGWTDDEKKKFDKMLIRDDLASLVYKSLSLRDVNGTSIITNVIEKKAAETNTKLYTFESGIPEELQADSSSKMTLSEKHHKGGYRSLEWNYEKGSQMVLSTPIGFQAFDESSGSNKLDTFAFWVYNEKPVDDEILIEFGRGDDIDCSFTFGLNFSGWRTAWVSYERDMQGKPREDMDTMRIKAPSNVEKGTLYFDQIILTNPVDSRHQNRDFQVPFVNVEADNMANKHWVSLYKFYNLESKEELPEEVTKEDMEAFDMISQRLYDNLFIKKNIDEKAMNSIRKQFHAFNIVRKDSTITGNSVDLPFIKQIYPQELLDAVYIDLKHTNVRKQYTDIMFNIANAYHSTDNPEHKDELSSIFIDMTEHMLDQGWEEGSILGTVHHIGYNMRGYYNAVFLMQNQLKEAGLLDRVQKSIYWFTGMGRIYDYEDKEPCNVDILNTTIQGMLISILVKDDTPDKVRDFQGFSDWMNRCMKTTPGLIGGFKEDGSGFHHRNGYPGYANPAFNGLTPVVYYMSGTKYGLKEEAHELLKKVIMVTRLYTNKYQWLVSLSGRGVDGTSKINDKCFGFMALAGIPDGEEEIDPEVAAAYLRLTNLEKPSKTAKMLLEMGYTPENDPNGNWTMNYSNLALHRRDDWLVGVRGHSKYLWGNESYTNSNLYGRYITYGQVQIMSQGDPINNKDSGYNPNGYNWNRWPGTTTIQLPIEELKSDVKNLDEFSGFEEMLISDESYSGALNIEGENGMFAMKLHEHPKYDESHRARKSVFFFDDRIILLGSDIENNDSTHNTQTTMFQNYLADKNMPIWVNSKENITEFPYVKDLKSDEDFWLMDNNNNGYYIPEGHEIGISRSTQDSKNHKNEKDTKGDFATAWIDHGKAPKNQGYEYAILVKTDEEKINDFTKQMSNRETALYTVLQKDKTAHIVKDRLTNTTGYAVFEANDNIDKGIVEGVDTPTMIMTKQSKDNMVLSIVDPDLRLYEGKDESQYDENGNRKEVSIYSRQWCKNESGSSTVKLMLNGEWNLSSSYENCRLLSSKSGKTELEFTCKDAKPIEIVLNKN
ncbi:chondroitin sulfate ABC exolyase [Vallitalea longa]|uniref:Chondroitin sulfate ABC exolyase n=1 Tax=Vallitalea longa TaxID=2936439 RepID=A0A9W6DEP7_9FIRM|nr:chondroitinase family polysaccharide lyase [Vallitalea longa]GKX29745.1 chondroitin sulfate ABC exolyase [Vallitalea longa]